MPKPRKDETKDKFISRCMGHTEMNDKFPDNKQRAAVCYSYWDDKQQVKESVYPTFLQFLEEAPKPDFKSWVGLPIIKDGKKVAEVTDVEQEGHKWWIVLNDSYGEDAWEFDLKTENGKKFLTPKSDKWRLG